MVAWGLVAKDDLKVEGETKEYASSEHGRRHFCPQCGTGLFYTSEAIFPGQIDVQIATLDDPDSIVPQAQIQLAERIGWMDKLELDARIRALSGALKRTDSESARVANRICDNTIGGCSRYPRYPQACDQIFRFPDSDARCIVKR